MSSITTAGSQDNHSENAAAQRASVLERLEEFRPVVIKEPTGFIKYPFCIPGGFYTQQWDWDGFFIACHLANRIPARPEYLKYWALNFLASDLPDGDLAACVSPDGAKLRHESLRLKPFIAQGVELSSRLLGDDSWVGPNYDNLVRIATRREATHYVPEYGLFVWYDAMQSGADNNPAVGNEPEMRKQILSCDVNAFQYREYLALSKIAGRLNRPEDEKRFAAKAAALKEAINSRLWFEEDQTYWNIDIRDGKPVKCVSYSNFVPLWAGIVPFEKGRAMIARYLWTEEHMLTDYGLRSLSLQDPDYNNVNMIVPYSNWQGPVWPIANYFYFVALLNHGFKEEANDLVDRLTRLYLADIEFCGSLHENYDAETGKPLAPSADQSSHGLEGGFIGWNLLLQDMIEMTEGRPNLLAL